MSDHAVAKSSTGSQASTGYLIAGVALQSPNQDPDAIPIPEAIKFLYSLPRPSVNDLDPRDSACPICCDTFTTNGPSHDVDVFRTKPEVPMILPCKHILGARCAWKLYSPFERTRGREHRCPICRREFFAQERLANNPAGVARAIRLSEWVTQECRRRLVEGPEEGKEDARESIEYMEQQRKKIDQQSAEMQTGRVSDMTVGARREIQTLTEQLQMFQDRRDILDASLTSLMGDGYAQEAQVLQRFSEQRTRSVVDLDRVWEQETIEMAAGNPDNVAALREQHMDLAYDLVMAARQENEALLDLLTRLRQESAERESAR